MAGMPERRQNSQRCKELLRINFAEDLYKSDVKINSLTVPKVCGSGQMGVDMKEKIIALITEILQVPEGTVTETTLMEDLEVWDSVAQVMIIGELESRLGISVQLEEAMEMTGVADILAISAER